MIIHFFHTSATETTKQALYSRLIIVAATDLIVHIREHLPILLGTRVTAFREPQNRKAAK